MSRLWAAWRSVGCLGVLVGTLQHADACVRVFRVRRCCVQFKHAHALTATKNVTGGKPRKACLICMPLDFDSFPLRPGFNRNIQSSVQHGASHYMWARIVICFAAGSGNPIRYTNTELSTVGVCFADATGGTHRTAAPYGPYHAAMLYNAVLCSHHIASLGIPLVACRTIVLAPPSFRFAPEYSTVQTS